MIVFDLDGTLSIVGDRKKYLQGENKDWDAFYGACGEDKLNEPIAKIYCFMETHGNIRVVTGRRESCREDTLEWFRKHNLYLLPSDLLMRADGDFRHDTIVKPELVQPFFTEIEMVFEDRDSMVRKWREMGLVCLQVAEGNF